MVKIKQKKTMNLPQLIEHIWANNLSHKWKDSDNTSAYVQVYDDGQLVVDKCTKDSVFTVEVEEEITEDTVIPKLMTTFKRICLKGGIGYQRVRIDDNYPINLMLNKAEAHGEPVETLHIVNDDGTHTLIWKNGKLVE